MRICVLSNSHAAALKTGYALLDSNEQQRLSVTFFASRASGLAWLRPARGKLVAMRDHIAQHVQYTSGGLSEVIPADYDAFIVHGLGLGVRYDVYDDCYRSTRMVETLHVLNTQLSLCMRLHEGLRSITDKPIFLSPMPFSSELHASVRELVAGSPTDAFDLSALPSLMPDVFKGATTFFAQPADTVAHGIFTLHRYSEGSIRLGLSESTDNIPHPTDVYTHMNAAYGLRYWQTFSQRAA